MLNNSCAFTGHRPHKFAWRYNEADRWCAALKNALADQITALSEAGVTEFYCGGADGTDSWAALIVLHLKKQIPHFGSTASCPMKARQTDGVIQHRNGITLFWSMRIRSNM